MNMQINKLIFQLKSNIVVACVLACAMVHSSYAGTPAQNPLFLSSPVRPIMMLNMSKEHQLFFKLYDDYSNITDAAGGGPDANGIADTTYNNNYNYFGYFDYDKCYTYASGLFTPVSFRTAKYCNAGSATGEWSGNFLNWASMTRIDAVRKILYGGLRSTDTATDTVLERTFLPNDAHSFAKYYNGTDINKLTPFPSTNTAGVAGDHVFTTGITICNTTEPTARATLSQNATAVTDAPLMRIAQGNYSLWASNERFQCRWNEDVGSGSQGKNGNISAVSLILANSSSPVKADVQAGVGDYIVRVKACVSGLINATNDEQCEPYEVSPPTTPATYNFKPIGSLQNFKDRLDFGLFTGSYGLNKSGGVLRKKAGAITDEINANGTFIKPTNSIIHTLDLLRIYGYDFNEGLYNTADSCSWGASSFDNGKCTNWGNPQAEIYLESLRYLAGLNSPNFDVNDSAFITGLNRVSSWGNPVTLKSADVNGNYCAPLNILQFNASTTSYDNDQLTGASSITALGNVASATDSIAGAAKENLLGGSFFVGNNGSGSNNQLCTPKTISALSAATGICPESPRLEGGYNLAGLAYLARTNGIGSGREKVKTFGVALAPAAPKVEIPVPGSTTQKITILPACRNKDTAPGEGGCAIVDFKISKQPTTVSGVTTGQLYVNWEDSEQGGDFDQDMWGVINYSISSTQVTITTNAIAQSTPNKMAFGYVIGGVGADDGFHAYSGINNFTGYGCTNCVSGGAPASNATPFTVATTSAATLKSPLYYAAKWGGFDNKTDGSTPTDAEIFGTTDANINYFFATNPRDLKKGLEKAFAKAANNVGSAATIAANSTRLEGETLIYQARFNSKDWSGRLLAFPLKADGSIDLAPKWDTDIQLDQASVAARKIYAYDGITTPTLQLLDINAIAWPTSLPNLKTALVLPGETAGIADANSLKRLKWLLGSNANESDTDLRVREKRLGDIVNSDPAFAGGGTQHFEFLPAATTTPSAVDYGRESYQAYVDFKNATGALGVGIKNRKSAILVSANDGMLHAFDADTGVEIFAYIPRGAYSKLAQVSKQDYSHQYIVDGPLFVGDAYISGAWRTVVAGTLGSGGRGAFALDITDTLTKPISGAPKVLFDVTSGDTPATALSNSLGYSMSKVLIAPTANGKWTAIFGNGNNSITGTSQLITIDIGNPTSYKVINTQVSLPSGANGLSGTALLPGANGIITDAYAGDIAGNMWRFDLSGSNSSGWDVKYKTSGNPAPLILVHDAANVAQPITAAPTLGKNALKKVSGVDSTMVYFGTGKYYETTDNTSTQVQSIYGIADTGKISLSLARTELHQKIINTSTSTATKRAIDNDSYPATGTAPTWTSIWSAKNGWYLDLTASGERVLGKPLLLYDRLLLSTFIPSSYQCEHGGKGWLMELTGVGDKFEGYSLLGVDANTLLDSPILGDLAAIVVGEKIDIIGSTLDKGLKTLVKDTPAGTKGRMSWRQLK